MLVADSHPLCREGLTTLFARNLGLSHLIEAWDFPSVIATMGARRSIDLITIDLGLPGMRKREGLRDLRVKYRSEEHTSELQSLMRISYAVFCLKKKKNK